MPSPDFDSLPCEIKWHIFAHIPESHVTPALTSTRLLSRINAIDLAPLLGLRCPPVRIMFNALGLAHFQWIADSTLAPYITSMEFVDMYFLEHMLLFRDEETNRAKDRQGHVPPIVHVQRMPTYRCQGQNIDHLMRTRLVKPGLSRVDARRLRMDELWKLWSVRYAMEEEIIEKSLEGEGLSERDIDVIAGSMDRFQRVEIIGSCTVTKATAKWCEHRDGPEIPLQPIYAPGPISANPQQYWSLSPMSHQTMGIRNFARICERLMPLEFGRKVTSLILTTTGSAGGQHCQPPPHAVSIKMILETFPKLRHLECDHRAGSPAYHNSYLRCKENGLLTARLAEAFEELPQLQLQSLKLNVKAHPRDVFSILKCQRNSLVDFSLVTPIPSYFWEHRDALSALIETLELLKAWSELRVLRFYINVASSVFRSPNHMHGIRNPLHIGAISEEALPRSKLLSLALLFVRAVRDAGEGFSIAEWYQIRDAQIHGVDKQSMFDMQKAWEEEEERKLNWEAERQLLVAQRNLDRMKRAERKRLEGLD